MEQRYRVQPGIGFCRFEGRTIVLDIAADRYWQLGEDAGRVLEAVEAGPIAGIDERAVARLATLGFIAPVDDGPRGDVLEVARVGTSLPLPAASALEQGGASAPADWATVAEVAVLAVAARVALRGLALKAILDRLVARRDRMAPRRPAASSELLARRFARCRRLVPLRPLCLPDSIAFLWFAARRGHAPRLVFGVEAFPFTAHCWVQEDGIVLTDALGHASRFKPILVL